MLTDPYLKIVSEFNKKGVEYIVVGVSGVNYYAHNARQIIMTGDYDVFIKPEPKNVFKALKILKEMKYSLIAGETVLKPIDEKTAQELANNRKTITCESYYHNIIELCLDVSGFTFETLQKNVKVFKAGKEKICVAKLRDLLKMKEIADRPKDRMFLQKYSDLLKE
ncbi:MAG: hypothetical protein A3J83_02025 [Elusimicrobia bacterium RIFOXYA2_FULL_40_6]|nr:MAG: hypothetical protein A3J83_02025 [Elusimicrobia bacterium RIFOXYA2_FULL_40_6]